MAKKKSKTSGRVWVEEKHPRGKGGKFASKGIPKISELHKDALHKAMAAKGLTVKKRTFSTAHTMDLSKFHQGKLSLKELEELATKLNLEHPIKYRNRKASWNDVITKHLSASGIKVPNITAKPTTKATSKAVPSKTVGPAKESEAYAKKHYKLLGSGVEGQVYHDGKGTALKFYNRQTPVPDKTIQDMKTLGQMGIGPKFISHKQVKVHGLDRTQPVVAMEHLTGFKQGLSTEAIPSHLANIRRLHSAGLVPTDLHDDNIMSKGSVAKLIDTSLATATPKVIAAQLLDVYGGRPDTAQTIQSVLEGRGAAAKTVYKKLQRQYKDGLSDSEYKRLADEVWNQLDGKKAKPKAAAAVDHKQALLEQAAKIKMQVGTLDKPGSYAQHDGDADRVAAFAHLAKAGFTKYNTEDEAISLMKGSTHWAQSSPDRSKHAKLKHHELAAAGIANGHIVTFGMLSPDKKKEAAMQLAATGNPYHRTADKELHALGEQMAKLAGTKGHSAMGKAVLKQTASYQHVETVKAKELDRRRSALAQLIGEEKVKKLEDSFNQATKDTRTHVRIPTDAVLNKIIKSGGLKTAHEVGLDSSYLDLRDNVEHKLFGIKKRQIEGRPLYGYQAPHGDYGGDAHAGAQMYGGLILRLKPDVENRTTVSLGDTFTGVVPTVKGKFNAGALLHPEAMSESTGKVRSDMETVAKGRIRDYEQNSKHINDLAERYSYVESQVHGGIKLSDIESVVVPPDAHAKGINVSDETRELLKKHGIAIEEHKPPKGVRRAPSSISKAAKASKLLDDILDGLV